MNIVYIILAIVLVIGLVILVKFVPVLKVAVLTICGLAVIVFTGYSTFELNKYYTAKGGLFGAISGYFDTNQVQTDNLSFNFKNIELTQEHDDTYSAKIMTNDIFVLKTNTNYSMYVNDNLCSNVKSASDYIMAEYTYNFYNENLNLIVSDTLNFKFAFYDNSSTLLISTNGGATAVKYWNYYFNRNNFVVAVKEATYVQNPDIEYGEGEVPELSTISFYVDSEKATSILIPANTTISDLEYKPTKTFYNFKGWSLSENGTVLNQEYKITGDINLYAVFEQTAGLYNEDGSFKLSWEDLTKEGIIEVSGTNLTSAFNGSYQHASKLTGVLIVDENIETIKANAFEGCYGLVKVYLPDSLTYIEKSAFLNCTNLKSIIMNNVREIGNDAFNGCTSLVEVELSERVEDIKDKTFSGCSSLRNIDLKNVKSIGQGAFYSCISLVDLKMPNATEIEPGAFAKCTSLRSIFIPISVVDIPANDLTGARVDDSLFMNCSNNLIIYCETTSQPTTWTNTYWNFLKENIQLQVKWGYSYDQYLAEIQK